jgi:hypothetical protein
MHETPYQTLTSMGRVVASWIRRVRSAARATLKAYNVLLRYTQEAVFAFTDPEGMEKVDHLSHRKCREVPLPMHFLNEAKTCLKFWLQSLKCCELLLRFVLGR